MKKPLWYLNVFKNAINTTACSNTTARSKLKCRDNRGFNYSSPQDIVDNRKIKSEKE